MATTGGRMTTKLEQEFFEAMGITPTMLTDCSYKNLQLYRYEYGDDCCEHLDDIDFTCDMCPKSRQHIPYYPTITDTIVLRLIEIILLTSDDHNLSVEHICDEIRFLFCEKIIILENEQTLKDCILSSCIQLKDEIREEVQKVF